MKRMLQPFQFKNGVELPNRLVLAPMTHYSSEPTGEVSEHELAYYRKRAQNVGLAITACAYVTEDGKGFPNAFGVNDDKFIPGLRQLAESLKAEGAKAILQIFHAGRMSPPELVPNEQPVSASAVAPVREGAATPRALETEEVEAIIEAFGEATRRAIEAGFDGVEIHGANTYLIQQFFSPHSNRREDRFGGDVHGRLTFPREVIRRVKEAAADAEDFLVGYRFSPEEIEEPGITLDDTDVLLDMILEEGVDYIHASLWNFNTASMRDENVTERSIDRIAKRINGAIPLIGVGQLQRPAQVEDALEVVDLAALGRELIIDPEWLEKVKSDREDEIETELDLNKQAELAVPAPLWNAITTRAGWFPIKDQEVK